MVLEHFHKEELPAHLQTSQKQEDACEDPRKYQIAWYGMDYDLMYSVRPLH